MKDEKTTRILHIELHNCTGCPYLDWEENQSCSNNSGWSVCGLVKYGSGYKRHIVQNIMRPTEFPEWCPLEKSQKTEPENGLQGEKTKKFFRVVDEDSGHVLGYCDDESKEEAKQHGGDCAVFREIAMEQFIKETGELKRVWSERPIIFSHLDSK